MNKKTFSSLINEMSKNWTAPKERKHFARKQSSMQNKKAYKRNKNRFDD